MYFKRMTASTAMGLTMLVAGCAKPPVIVQAPPPPPAPVGHVYLAQAVVPAPVSNRIKYSAAQQAQVQQAFNVIALKSDLMVGALSCETQAQYDAFMTKFQPHILAEQHVMDAYFHKASGRYSGQKIEDSYVTLLANNQSVSGIGEGGNFCLNTAAEFNAVLGLSTPAALDRFVTDQAPAGAISAPMAPP